MPITFLAQSTSDNAPGGAVLTFAFPIILFAIIATVLYSMLFARPYADTSSPYTSTPGAAASRSWSRNPLAHPISSTRVPALMP